MSTHIPETFDEWRHCIEQECRIVLTKEYIEQRLAILRELNHEETQRFIRHYGEHHWQQVVRWFERAQNQWGQTSLIMKEKGVKG
ncbi:hypothetical protein [Nitrosomonas sp. ANs5]|uniref:hypothetical protein n=1 Tax=Nitrosomonas sp. ANs5 TaxID=3423941 RepID=UPI003D3283AC